MYFFLRRTALTLAFWVLSLLCSAEARAMTFTSITAIGDSLFDGGNEPTAVVSSYKVYGVPSNYVPPVGYYNFKYCDGYTSAEYFSYFMGMYDTAHFFNYAVAGISTLDLPAVLQQIYYRTPAVDPTGLYLIFVGGQDIFRSQISRDQTAENIKNAVLDLYNHGGRYFMVMNLPKMSDLPNYNTLSTAEVQSVDIAYQAVNNALKTKLSALAFANNVVQFDTANFSHLITLYARGEGFTNLSEACAVNNTVCATPKTYIFWDDVHYTSATNGHLGALLKAAVQAAPLGTTDSPSR